MHGLQERLSRGSALGAGLATGLLYALAQAPFACWPLAFVCLAPFGVSLGGRGLVARAGLGALAGAAAGWASSLLPVAEGLARFFDRPTLFGVASGLAVTGGFGAIGFACAAALAGDPARQRPWLLPWRFGAAFALGEWVRSHVATGMPWALLAHALAPAPRSAQLAAAIGVLGLGSAVAAASGAAVAAVRRQGRAAALASGVAVALLLAAAERLAPAVAARDPGSIAVATPGAARPDGALRVALVQPGPTQAGVGVGQRLARLVALSRRASGADLVLWPENAFGAALPANESTVRDAVAALDPRPAVLFGAPRYEPSAPTRSRNAALLWDADGRVLGVHDKVRLLPFTEYVPRPFAALGFGGGHTMPGERLAPLDFRGTRLGVLICYELLFAPLAQSLVAQGATLLVNPSNDAWFGDTAGGEQMLAAAVLRAIETRRPLLRVTPTGVTAAIDARGRVVARLAPGASEALVVDVWAADRATGR